VVVIAAVVVVVEVSTGIAGMRVTQGRVAPWLNQCMDVDGIC
jgi:hypothetical protein